MALTPQQRIARLARQARRGLAFVRADATLRARSRAWLWAHPAPNVALDGEWRNCLEGRGALAAWLLSSATPEAWVEPLPLHSLLASHPFPELELWSIQQMFRAL